VLIDAPPNCSETIKPLLEKESLILKEIWLTHGHWDHMAGAADLVEGDTVVIGHRDDKTLFEQPAVMSAFAMPGMDFEPVAITKWVEDGDFLNLFGKEVVVNHCPGHCPGNVIFWIKEESICFVGDVIFAGSIGRADLPGGDFADLEKSIQSHIYTLPEETKILPGHGPDTTVGDERRDNPFVRPI
jgi:glyoxylase-like metal-dependent hydrolase (beta-lactamase superfamily II)